MELKGLITKLQENIDLERAKRHEHDIKITTLEQELQYFKEKLEIVFNMCVNKSQKRGDKS